MKIKSFIAAVLALCSVFVSCRSVYSDVKLPSDGNDSHFDVDTNGEYFTKGELYRRASGGTGVLYEGSWIYDEQLEEVTYRYESEDGMKVQTVTESHKRLVKVNAVTGTVSCLCLNPTCNHSPGSDCVMLSPIRGSIHPMSVIGDWLLFYRSMRSDIYNGVVENYLYNLKTGEFVSAFPIELGELTRTEWDGFNVFDGKLYVVKHELDYSDVKYDKGGDKWLSDYEAKTVSTLFSYDPETQKMTELMKLPDGYSLAGMTNKRFFFQSPESVIYSVKREGGELIKEEVLDFVPFICCGTYGFHYSAEDGVYSVYDLKTNTKTVSPSPEGKPISFAETDIGLLRVYYSNYDEWKRVQSSFLDLKKEHSEMSPSEFSDYYNDVCNKAKYSGSSRIYRTSLDGKTTEFLYEKEHAHYSIAHATDKYMYVFAIFGDPENGYSEIPPVNQGRHILNIETGELIPIPLADYVLRDDLTFVPEGAE